VLRRLKAALTARSVVLTLLVLLAAAMAVAALVPQVGGPPLEGQTEAGATGDAIVAALGAHRVFSTPWFAALAALSLLALALSTVDQLRLALARTRQPPGEGAGEERSSPLPADQLERLLRGEGYRRLGVAGDRSRHVRHWQGYWGGFLLHAGLTVSALFAATYLLTEHRTTVLVVSGRPSVPSPGVRLPPHGLLARDVPLPAEVSLYRVEPAFGANDQLVDLASVLVFTDREGASREVRVAVNDHQDYRGVTVYQLLKYGHAFLLEARDGSGPLPELLVRMPFPARRGAPSYANQPLGGGRVLKAKYFASADHRELLSDAPQLVLRLQEGERVLGEATLQAGQEAPLGPWTVRLARAGWWTEILFEGSQGVSGIFAGFGLLVAGAILVFFFVPREVVVRATPAGCTVRWRSTRLPALYRQEGERLLARCAGGGGVA
jgi:hypothetical protein